MTIIATCGHEVSDFDQLRHATIKGYSRDCTRCLEHVSLCSSCYKMHQTEHAVLYTKEQENQWLFGSDD